MLRQGPSVLAGQLGQFHVAANDAEQVVEVVRDTTGEGAERFEFLRLAHARLERLLTVGRIARGREVAQDDVHHGREQVRKLGRGDGDRHGPAVGASELRLRRPLVRRERDGVERRQDAGEIASGKRVGRHAAQRRRAAVDHGDPPLLDEQVSVVCLLEERAEGALPRTRRTRARLRRLDALAERARPASHRDHGRTEQQQRVPGDGRR